VTDIPELQGLVADPAGARTKSLTDKAKRATEFIMRARGWRRAGLAFAAGAASTLAQAPTHFWPILFLTFPLLVWLIDSMPAGRRRAAWLCAQIGWCFGFGYFTVGLYWIGHAFLVDAQTFGWLLPIAVTGLPAFLAVFPAMAIAVASMVWTQGPVRILALAAALTASEWLRGHLLTGFPWNAFGYALTSPLELAQSASLVGIWGMTFIAIAIFASPATLVDNRSNTAQRWLPFACGLFALAVMAGFGAWRLARTPTAFVDGVELRIMQPNLQQDEKFNYSAKAQVMDLYLRLSAGASAARPDGLSGVTHLIWPESAFPFFLTREPDALAQIAALLSPGRVLITGADRSEEGTGANTASEIHTSVYVIDDRGSVLGRYDKVHLVPFGEFLPFQDWLERLGLTQLTKVEGGISAGEGRRSMAVPGAPPMLALICYEIIFPGEVVPSGERPGWLLNVSNDGWFGISTGPYQHLQQARVRAIEEGLPVVRAANTGISAIIDPLGRVVRALPLGAQGLLDARLPAGISPTPYVLVRNSVAMLMVLLAGGVAIWQRIRG
jgi:apolipoprotein N-acyltransferase